MNDNYDDDARPGVAGGHDVGPDSSAPAGETLLVDDLRVSSGTRELLRGIDLHVRRGERVGLIGESGSGKSLTAFSVMGLLDEYLDPAGEIRVDGVESNVVGGSETTLSRMRGRISSMVFQEPMTALNPLMKVGAQIAEVMLIHRTQPNRSSARAAAIDLMGQVKLPNPESLAQRYPHELSGGQRQRVVLAIALANDPELLVCDEPTTALDVTVQQQMLELINRLVAERDTALLFITHDLAVVASICDRVAVMLDGSIVEQGSISEVFTNPQHPYTRALIAASDLTSLDADGRLFTVDTATDQFAIIDAGGPAAQPRVEAVWGPGPLAKHQVLDDSHPTVFNEQPDANDVVIRARGLDRFYRGRRPGLFKPREPVRGIEGASFDVRAGQGFGIVGESGSGKSTLIRILSGLDKPTSGEVDVDGIDLTTADSAQMKRVRDAVSIVFQDPMSSLDPRMTVEQIVSEPLHGVSREERRERTAAMLESVGLEADVMDRKPHQFSGGQRQRISIARALITKPRILVADEPVSALDVSVRAQVLNLIADLVDEYQLTLVFVSHDLGVVRHVCDTVAVVSQGRIVECGPTDAVYENPLHEYTQKLVSATPDLATELEKRG